MDLGLSGRTVIVTGATGGIGRKLVRHFAAEGAQVVSPTTAPSMTPNSWQRRSVTTHAPCITT